MKHTAKIFLSVFFLLNFMSFTIVPSLVILVDNDSELILLNNSAEEEDSKEENTLENDVFAANTNSSILEMYLYKDIYSNKDRILIYPLPYCNLVSPPPEAI